MNFENYVLKMMVFPQNFSQTSSKDNNGKGIFSIFTLYLRVVTFLAEDLMS